MSPPREIAEATEKWYTSINMRAKKSLGQHFLRSPQALSSIVEAGDIQQNDTILEIGPGEGVLTKELLAHANYVISVEKDTYLIEPLKEKFSNEIAQGKLKIIHEDILEFNLKKLSAGTSQSYKLIANIPYYITGEIFRKFLEHPNQPERMVFLVQKEVAERIVARNDKESVLSISVKCYGKPMLVKKVPRGSFSPPPNVDSAIILISDISKNFFRDFSEKRFFEVLRAGFSHKRKFLARNLESVTTREIVQSAFKKNGLSLTVRAEDVSLSQWGKLAKEILE